MRIAWGIFQQEIPDDTKEGFVSNTVYTLEPNCLKMGHLGRATCTVHLISPQTHHEGIECSKTKE